MLDQFSFFSTASRFQVTLILIFLGCDLTVTDSMLHNFEKGKKIDCFLNEKKKCIFEYMDSN